MTYVRNTLSQKLRGRKAKLAGTHPSGGLQPQALSAAALLFARRSNQMRRVYDKVRGEVLCELKALFEVWVWVQRKLATSGIDT